MKNKITLTDEYELSIIRRANTFVVHDYGGGDNYRPRRAQTLKSYEEARDIVLKTNSRKLVYAYDRDQFGGRGKPISVLLTKRNLELYQEELAARVA
jgi:hypothetical protein